MANEYIEMIRLTLGLCKRIVKRTEMESTEWTESTKDCQLSLRHRSLRWLATSS